MGYAIILVHSLLHIRAGLNSYLIILLLSTILLEYKDESALPLFTTFIVMGSFNFKMFKEVDLNVSLFFKLQITVSLVKLLIIGPQEIGIGTVSFHEGSMATIISILGWVYFSQVEKSRFMAFLVLIVALASKKLAIIPLVVFVEVIFAIRQAKFTAGNLLKTAVSSLVVFIVLLLYLSNNSRISNLNYHEIEEYFVEYTNTMVYDKSRNMVISGRTAAQLAYWLSRDNQSFLLGYNSVGSNSWFELKERFGYGIRSGAIFLHAKMGVMYFVLLISHVRKMRQLHIPAVLIGVFLFDHVFYSLVSTKSLVFVFLFFAVSASKYKVIKS